MNISHHKSHGLSNRDIQTLLSVFQQYPEVKRVVLFGSRAKGTYNQGSDIDLAILDENISNQTIRAIKTAFEESSLPYRVDIAYLAAINSVALKEHVNRVGVAVF